MKIAANGIQTNDTLEGPAEAPVVTMSHSLATGLTIGTRRPRRSRAAIGCSATTRAATAAPTRRPARTR